MTARALMLQGTGSDVGKSLLVAGLCRLFARRGLRVVPFKAQNMSNNAAVTEDGGEIGRAQWLQAIAANIAPSVHMNPVLLKPQSDQHSQVIVRGKHVATMRAQEYQAWRASLMPAVLESYYELAANADLILVEGAGSPAEVNLRANDIANMGFARAAECPVALIGDIERGGVIASLVGTHAVLSTEDRAMIRGFIVNKFRGDLSLFDKGAKEIERFTHWPHLGTIPYHHTLAQLPQEDSLALAQKQNTEGAALHIAVLACPHIANFDDIDPITNEPGVKLTWCRAGGAIPGDAQLVILPGSKSTIADLAFLRAQGWDIDLRAHVRRGGRVLGICGGYQMLGYLLSDPHGIEGTPQTAEGLGLLDVTTVFTREKTVTPWRGEWEGIAAEGYEIHVGETTGPDCARGWIQGAQSRDGLVWGTYVHGLFTHDAFRRQFFALPSGYGYRDHMNRILESWADVLEQALNPAQLLSLAAPVASISPSRLEHSA